MNGSVSQEDVAKLIREECDSIANLLVEKNRKYGNAVINPVSVFSRSDVMERINVRIDDKLQRIANRQDDEDEDVEKDLIGYLLYRRVVRRLISEATKAASQHFSVQAIGCGEIKWPESVDINGHIQP